MYKCTSNEGFEQFVINLNLFNFFFYYDEKINSSNYFSPARDFSKNNQGEVTIAATQNVF